MPYFVYRISAERKLALVNVYDKFQEAKDVCRKMRADMPADSVEQVRMAFAQSEKEAKRLLSDKREPSSPLEEWEA